MEIETLKFMAMILSFIMGTLALLKFIRSDYEKKIEEIENTMTKFHDNFYKQLQSNRKHIHKMHIQHAHIETLTQCIKETIEKVDKKIDRLSVKTKQGVSL